MNKFIILAFALVVSTTAMATSTKTDTSLNLKLSSFTELDKGHRTSIGLTLDVARYNRFSAGLFAGFDSDVWLNTLRNPGQKNWFDGQSASVGPVISYTVGQWGNLSVDLAGGYLGTMRTLEIPKHGKWVAGVSLGFKF